MPDLPSHAPGGKSTDLSLMQIWKPVTQPQLLSTTLLQEWFWCPSTQRGTCPNVPPEAASLTLVWLWTLKKPCGPTAILLSHGLGTVLPNQEPSRRHTHPCHRGQAFRTWSRQRILKQPCDFTLVLSCCQGLLLPSNLLRAHPETQSATHPCAW